MSISTKEKGLALEQHVCDLLKEKGIDPKAYPSRGSGATTGEKSDVWTSAMVLGQNIGFECKNQAALCVDAWWKQTRKLEKLSREPVLVFKHIVEPIEEARVVIYLDTFLELVKRANVTRETSIPALPSPQNTSNDRNLEYAAKNALRAVKELAEAIENRHE